ERDLDAARNLKPLAEGLNRRTLIAHRTASKSASFQLPPNKLLQHSPNAHPAAELVRSLTGRSTYHGAGQPITVPVSLFSPCRSAYPRPGQPVSGPAGLSRPCRPAYRPSPAARSRCRGDQPRSPVSRVANLPHSATNPPLWSAAP